MKTLIKLLIIATVLAFSSYALANTFNVTNLACGIQITDPDTAWTWTDHYTEPQHAGGIKVDYIFFTAGATGDIVTIHDGSAAGIVLFTFVGADIYDQRRIPFHGKRIRPYLATPAGAPNAAAFITIVLSEWN